MAVERLGQTFSLTASTASCSSPLHERFGGRVRGVGRDRNRQPGAWPRTARFQSLCGSCWLSVRSQAVVTASGASVFYGPMATAARYR